MDSCSKLVHLSETCDEVYADLASLMHEIEQGLDDSTVTRETRTLWVTILESCLERLERVE